MMTKWFKNWLDLLFWWLPKTPDAPGEQHSARTESQAPGQAHEAEPAAPATEAGDDLTAIKGIGPATQEKLQAHGVSRFADLAAADPGQLTAQLRKDQPGISEKRVRGWIDAARARTAGEQGR
ncbi:large subunit ribosomal protein L21 [Limimonas halophila]|uniref:Large subunit ribosomal protein L21 n=1 Tax=Limimonas halophila TaxID=1082479 RepID=A0A1G7NU98_9PROT|nr:helix-hairpin-helix domain-containing protein [Limimonas halophila]SDF76770.1 large subunit ribosomal protein L21 [Limimonas halophila]